MQAAVEEQAGRRAGVGGVEGARGGGVSMRCYGEQFARRRFRDGAVHLQHRRHARLVGERPMAVLYIVSVCCVLCICSSLGRCREKQAGPVSSAARMLCPRRVAARRDSAPELAPRPPSRHDSTRHQHTAASTRGRARRGMPSHERPRMSIEELVSTEGDCFSFLHQAPPGDRNPSTAFHVATVAERLALGPTPHPVPVPSHTRLQTESCYTNAIYRHPFLPTCGLPTRANACRRSPDHRRMLLVMCHAHSGAESLS